MGIIIKDGIQYGRINPSGLDDTNHVVWASHAQNLTDAQKQTARNNIGAVSTEDVDEALNYYVETDVSISASLNDWKLDGTGKCTQDTSYKLVKYEVTPGDTLHLKLSKDSGGVYQWQSAASVPSSLPNANLVGTPVTTAIDDNVDVPAGATWLIVSQYKTNATNSVKLTTEDGTVKEKVIELEEIANGAIRFDEAQTLTDAEKETARNNIGAGTTGGAIGTITLGASWSSGNPHTQMVTVDDYTVTENTKVDLLVTPTSLGELTDMGVSGIQAINDNGVVTVYAYGKAPTESVMLYCLCSEVVNDAPEPGPDIPSEYQQVEYIQSDGSGQYIDTLINSDSSCALSLDVQFNAADAIQIFGSTGNSGTSQFRSQVGIDRTGTLWTWYWGIGNKNLYDTEAADTNRHTLYFDIFNRVYGVDNRENTMPSDLTMPASPISILLFARQNEQQTKERYCNAKVYGAVIKKSGVEVARFVPCYVKATGEIGLYDTVRNQFFANVGTGAFTKGDNDTLPSEYQRVQYIQSDGNQYIDTGVRADSNTAMTVDYQFTDATKLVQKVVSGVLGTTNARFSFGTRDTTSNYYFGHGNAFTYPGINADTNRHVAHMDLKTKEYSFDDVTGSLSSFSMTTSGTLALFAVHNQSENGYGYYATCRIYEAVFKNNGVNIAHFVPCYLKTTGEVGLYDVVRGAFYKNLGTGTFTKGVDV